MITINKQGNENKKSNDLRFFVIFYLKLNASKNWRPVSIFFVTNYQKSRQSTCFYKSTAVNIYKNKNLEKKVVKIGAQSVITNIKIIFFKNLQCFKSCTFDLKPSNLKFCI